MRVELPRKDKRSLGIERVGGDMYLWLKRLFYGCDHNYVFLNKFNTYDNQGNYVIRMTTLHRCSKCKKLKKDVINS